MNSTKKTLLLFSSLLLMVIAHAQEGLIQQTKHPTTISQRSAHTSTFELKDVTPLKIGDKIPDFEIRNMINYKTQGARISDFKGKIIILDFWATWCGPCVREMPKLDTLAKKYKDRMVILPVTREGERQVKKLINRINALKKTSLNSIVEDTVLHALFPFRTYPHYVWIDSNLTVQGITYGQSLNKNKLDSFAKGLNPILEIKEQYTPALNLDYVKPIFIQENYTLSDSLIRQYSILTRYIPGARAAMGGNKQNKLLITNVVPELLFRQAYAKELGANVYGFASYNQILIETKDSLKLTYSKTMTDTEIAAWHKNNAYTYDLMVSMKDTAKMLEIMKKDIEIYFNVKPSIEVLKRKVLVVTCDPNNKKYKSEGGKPMANSTPYSMDYRNIPMKRFLADLYKYYQSSISGIIDKTEYSGNIDLEISAQINNFPDLVEALKPWGITIKEEYKDVKVLILRDGSN